MRAKALYFGISLLMHASVVLAFGILGSMHYYKNEAILSVRLDNDNASAALKQSTGTPARNMNNAAATKKRAAQDLPIANATENRGLPLVSGKAELSDVFRLPLDNPLSVINNEAGQGPILVAIAQGTAGEDAVYANILHGKDKRAAATGGKNNNNVEREFGAVNGPSFLKMVKPVYPKLARKLGREGRVVLRLLIADDGKLQKVEVVERSGFGLEEAAIAAVRTSTYHPAFSDGSPVACRVILPVRFVLHED